MAAMTTYNKWQLDVRSFLTIFHGSPLAPLLYALGHATAAKELSFGWWARMPQNFWTNYYLGFQENSLLENGENLPLPRIWDVQPSCLGSW